MSKEAFLYKMRGGHRKWAREYSKIFKIFDRFGVLQKKNTKIYLSCYIFCNLTVFIIIIIIIIVVYSFQRFCPLALVEVERRGGEGKIKILSSLKKKTQTKSITKCFTHNYR